MIYLDCNIENIIYLIENFYNREEVTNMTSDQQKRLDILEKREVRRKKQVKQYFARRRLKEQFYKNHFEKTATEEQKKQLANAIANL